MQDFSFFAFFRPRSYVLAAVALFFVHVLSAQKIVTEDRQAWFGFWNQTRLTNRLGVWLDVQFQKRGNFIDSLLEFSPSIGATYYVADDLKITAAYAFVNLYPDGSRKILQPERRPWQQIQWHTRYEKFRLMQWIRLEERFRRHVNNGDQITGVYDFNYRLRYNFFLAIPLNKKGFGAGGLTYVLNDEIHLNFGDEVVLNTFDQNRFFTGFAYHFTPVSNLQAGYLNVFQQFASGNKYRNAYNFRIFYFQNLDFRRPGK